MRYLLAIFMLCLTNIAVALDCGSSTAPEIASDGSRVTIPGGIAPGYFRDITTVTLRYDWTGVVKSGTVTPKCHWDTSSTAQNYSVFIQYQSRPGDKAGDICYDNYLENWWKAKEYILTAVTGTQVNKFQVDNGSGQVFECEHTATSQAAIADGMVKAAASGALVVEKDANGFCVVKPVINDSRCARW